MVRHYSLAAVLTAGAALLFALLLTPEYITFRHLLHPGDNYIVVSDFDGLSILSQLI